MYLEASCFANFLLCYTFRYQVSGGQLCFKLSCLVYRRGVIHIERKCQITYSSSLRNGVISSWSSISPISSGDEVGETVRGCPPGILVLHSIAAPLSMRPLQLSAIPDGVPCGTACVVSFLSALKYFDFYRLGFLSTTFYNDMVLGWPKRPKSVCTSVSSGFLVAYS